MDIPENHATSIFKAEEINLENGALLPPKLR
jgi:hypothetical protein